MKARVAIVLLCVISAVAAPAQTGAAHDGFPALRFRHQEGKRGGSYFVEFISNYDKEPAFRIRAHHYHAWCNGYLYVTPTAIVYDPSLTPGQKDGITIRRQDVASFTPRFSGYEFAAPGKPYNLAFLSAPDRPLGPSEKDELPELMSFIRLAYSDFPAAKRQFVATLAGVNFTEAGRASPPAFEATPRIVVLDPAGAAPNGSVDGSGAAQPVMGVVAASSGIVTVAVNGDPARVTPLSHDVALFETGGRFVLAPGNNPFSITATAADRQQNTLAFAVVRPDVIITSPGAKVHSASVNLQGTITGMRDVTAIEVAGKPAGLQRRNDGGFDFHSQNLPLAVGPNFITGFTVAPNGQRSVFTVAVTRTPPVPLLTVERIERLLQAAVSPVRVASLVDEQGVDFELTPEIQKRLQAAGASQAVFDAIANGYTPSAPNTNASVAH